MPVYEYYCEKCDKVFDSLQAISRSDQPVDCPKCDRSSDRIMPTTFATMSRRKGLRERVPYHHHDVRDGAKKPPIARVKPKSARKRSASGKTKKG
ncbi:MAG: zinc ribbon domain-containing protein [Chloroflexi bacterium]|nr:zinc ribbon domain-containing protein [Chloroflexota bacterium]